MRQGGVVTLFLKRRHGLVHYQGGNRPTPGHVWRLRPVSVCLRNRNWDRRPCGSHASWLPQGVWPYWQRTFLVPFDHLMIKEIPYQALYRVIISVTCVVKPRVPFLCPSLHILDRCHSFHGLPANPAVQVVWMFWELDKAPKPHLM